MKSSRLGIVLILGLGLLAVLLAFFGPSLFDHNGRTELAEEQKAASPVQAGFSAKGMIESTHEVEISSQIQGVIDKVLVAEGDTVTTNQPLIRLAAEKIQARVQLAEAAQSEARAALAEQERGFRREDIAGAKSALARATAIAEQAAREAERQQRLLEKGATTRVDWERAEEQRQIAQAQRSELAAALEKVETGMRQESIEQARANLEKASADLAYHRTLLADYVITSPMEGLIISRDRDEQEFVDIGSPLLTLIDPSRLRVHAEVEETDFDRVSHGQSVEVTADPFPGKIFAGQVTQVFPTVNKKAQRTFDPMASFDINTQKIYIELQDYTGLVHGMTLTVRFVQ
jgi:multidrug resistance efflux pump